METGRSASELRNGELLPVAEMFYSVQGEGCNSGKAAYFLRLGGCNIHCPWCDAKNTWDASRYPLMPVGDIVQKISSTSAVNVVVTGGEPLLYPLDRLCKTLKDGGFNIFLETSGTCPPNGNFDWICVSPKRHRPPLPGTLAIANELKVVISGQEDFEWAEENRKHVSSECVLLLQAEWSKRVQISPLMVEYVKAHPEWRISLQTHKYLDIP